MKKFYNPSPGGGPPGVPGGPSGSGSGGLGGPSGMGLSSSAKY
jgi:hypothetical protein